MAQPAAQLVSSNKSAQQWVRLSLVAARTGMNAGNLRRKCAEVWHPQGLARLEAGEWFVHRNADPALCAGVSDRQTDLEQEAELAARGVDSSYIAVAKERRDVITGFTDFAAGCGTGFQPVTERLRLYLASLGDDAPSRSRFYVWRDAYSADNLRGLVPSPAFRAGNASAALGPAALDYIERILDCGNRFSVRDAVNLLIDFESPKHVDDPAWCVPSYRTVLAILQRRRPKILKVLSAKGPRAARAECVPKLMRDFNAIHAGDEYCGDEKTLDIWCRIWTSRGWKSIREIYFTAWIDMRSRVIVGIEIAPYANHRTILSSLKGAIVNYGKPLRLRVDRGKDYAKAGRHGAIELDGGATLDSVLSDLGITYRPVEGYSPWLKPIESFFRTFKTLHDQMFAAFWGGCPSERHEDRQKYVKENLEKLPTLDDIRATVDKALQLYHHSEHSAPDLFNKTPLQALAAFRDGPVRRESDEVLAHCFKMFYGPYLARRDGIRHEGHWYGNGDARITALPDRTQVILAIQPDDAGRAMMCDLRRRPMFEVECYEHRNQSIEQVREKLRQVRRALRPYAAQHSAARAWMLDQNPKEILSARAAAAKKRNPAPADGAPSLTVVRPDLEEAIANAGPAPSAIEAASKAARTGTDDEEISLDELTQASPFSAPQPCAEEVEDDDLW